MATGIELVTVDVLRVSARKFGGDPKELLHWTEKAYDRAARVAYGRIPASTAGNGLGAVARVLANTSTEDDRITRAMATLLHRLAELVDTITRLRMAERRTLEPWRRPSAPACCATRTSVSEIRPRVPYGRSTHGTR